MPPRRIAITLLLLTFLGADAFPSEVSFSRDIAPILQRRCVTCHGEETSKGDYRADTFAHLGKAGESELPALVPNKSVDSELYRLLVEPDAGDRMPQKADALPPAEIALIKSWIEQGAVYDGRSSTQSVAELARGVHLRQAPATYRSRVPITALAFSPDARQLAVNGYYEVLIWDLDQSRVVRRIGNLPERITSIAWERNGWLAVAGGAPAQWGTIALVAPGASAPDRYLCDLPETTLSVAFRPDGEQLVVGCGDRTVRVFEVKSGREERVHRHHVDWVQNVAYDEAGEHILTASRDRTARIVNARTGEVETTFTDHEAGITAGAFINSRQVITMDLGRKVHVWDRSSGKKRETWTSAAATRHRLVLWGSSVLVAGTSNSPELRDPLEGELIRTLSGHHAPVQTLAVAAGGDLLATGSMDGEVLLWRAGCETWLQRILLAPVDPPQIPTTRISSVLK